MNNFFILSFFKKSNGITTSIIFAMFNIVATGQNNNVDLKNFNYSKADSIALNFPKKKYKYYTEIVSPLVANLDTDHEKARVILRWIAENIRYNYSNRSSNPDKAIIKGKAVCIGYATLFRDMCMSAGIMCEVVKGYAKTEPKDIGVKPKKENHAWNAIYLNDKWYLIDPTWASGYYNITTKKHVKKFDDYYFLVPPYQLTTSHLPSQNMWFLSDTSISKSKFAKPPIIYNEFHKMQLQNLAPLKGNLKLKTNNPIKLSFTANKSIKQVNIYVRETKKYYSPTVHQNQGQYTVLQAFQKAGNYTLDLLVDNKLIATYNIEIK